MRGRARHSVAALTLVELLVVLSVVGFLLALLVPGLGKARQQARTAVCQSNVRQIMLANSLYAQESGGLFCPGAADFIFKNLHRWHGTRDGGNRRFDPERGPLAPYLGADHTIRTCPSFEPEVRGFEAGNGGYGYNNGYIGVQVVQLRGNRAIVTSDLAGAYVDKIARPMKTVMFSDSAFVAGRLVEYSFAEPRFHPQFGSRADPSIHFRHQGRTNVGWCDGHVTQESRAFTWHSGFYRGDPAKFDIGWFGQEDDNSLFDLR